MCGWISYLPAISNVNYLTSSFPIWSHITELDMLSTQLFHAMDIVSGGRLISSEVRLIYLFVCGVKYGRTPCVLILGSLHSYRRGILLKLLHPRCFREIWQLVNHPCWHYHAQRHDIDTPQRGCSLGRTKGCSVLIKRLFRVDCTRFRIDLANRQHV